MDAPPSPATPLPQAPRYAPGAPLPHAYYINSCFDPSGSAAPPRVLPGAQLREALGQMGLSRPWTVAETAHGLIVAFERKEDAEEVFEKMEVAKTLGGPVQVATLANVVPGGVVKGGDVRRSAAGAGAGGYSFGRFNAGLNQIAPHASSRPYMYQPPSRLLQPPGPVVIRDVPWSITTEELRAALHEQGIQVAAIERYRQHVRIEVKNIFHYEQLLTEGLNFYNSGRFAITAERPGSSGSSHSDTGNGQQDDVLQCYRCQGFGHVAANCRHLPRCVRCGEPHGVEYCTRARGNPLCCNCSGAHHAAYKNCPVRKSMAQAAPIAFVLSRDRPTGSFAEVTANAAATKPRCML